MPPALTPQGWVERWFDKLIKSKLGVGAIPLGGLGVGMAVIEFSRVTPDPYSEEILALGVRMMEGSAILFMAALAALIIVYVVNSRHALK